MAAQDPQAEPSMEEILASIRRIISEEDETEEADGPALDLVNATDEEPPAAPEDFASEDDIVFDETPAPEPEIELEAAPERGPEPALEPEFEAPPPATTASAAPSLIEEAADSILSEPAASAAAGSLSRLTAQLRISDAQGQTLEGVVREMLKPMLREWLDQNLPKIVESRVEAELERIARMSR